MLIITAAPFIPSSLGEAYQLFFFPWTSHLEKKSVQMLRWLKLVPVSILWHLGNDIAYDYVRCYEVIFIALTLRMAVSSGRMHVTHHGCL